MDPLFGKSSENFGVQGNVPPLHTHTPDPPASLFLPALPSTRTPVQTSCRPQQTSRKQRLMAGLQALDWGPKADRSPYGPVLLGYFYPAGLGGGARRSCGSGPTGHQSHPTGDSSQHQPVWMPPPHKHSALSLPGNPPLATRRDTNTSTPLHTVQGSLPWPSEHWRPPPTKPDSRQGAQDLLLGLFPTLAAEGLRGPPAGGEAARGRHSPVRCEVVVGAHSVVPEEALCPVFSGFCKGRAEGSQRPGERARAHTTSVHGVQ